MESFVEQRIELGLLYGTNGGPGFQTTIGTTDGRIEDRNIDLPEDLGSWDLGSREVRKVMLAYLLTFFRMRRGRAIGFRFKDWSDYVVPTTAIGTGDDATKTFQVKLVLDDGFGTPYTKTIVKTVGGTEAVYLNGVIVDPADYTWDHTKGQVTFIVAPALGVVVSVQCEFDKPVRFDIDRLPLRFDAYRDQDNQLFYNVPPIPIEELAPQEFLL